MVQFLVFFSNMALGFAVGLWALKVSIMKNLEKKKIIMTEATKQKLVFCRMAKYFMFLFVLMKIILFVT